VFLTKVLYGDAVKFTICDFVKLVASFKYCIVWKLYKKHHVKSRNK
jgi:hypothetical protein